jgi:hypothetical protein
LTKWELVTLFLEAISKMPNSPISSSGLNRNPQNIAIYSSGYDTVPSLTSNYFSIFEIATNNHLSPLGNIGEVAGMLIALSFGNIHRGLEYDDGIGW